MLTRKLRGLSSFSPNVSRHADRTNVLWSKSMMPQPGRASLLKLGVVFLILGIGLTAVVFSPRQLVASGEMYVPGFQAQRTPPTPEPPTGTPTSTSTRTNTPTITNTPTRTNTPTITNTPTRTRTLTATSTSVLPSATAVAPAATSAPAQTQPTAEPTAAPTQPAASPIPTATATPIPTTALPSAGLPLTWILLSVGLVILIFGARALRQSAG